LYLYYNEIEIPEELLKKEIEKTNDKELQDIFYYVYGPMASFDKI